MRHHVYLESHGMFYIFNSSYCNVIAQKIHVKGVAKVKNK